MEEAPHRLVLGLGRPDIETGSANSDAGYVDVVVVAVDEQRGETQPALLFVVLPKLQEPLIMGMREAVGHGSVATTYGKL